MLPYLSKAWQWAIQKKKWIQVNPFAELSVKRDGPKPIEYLEEDQLATLEKLLPVGTLARVRDCFLWQCYTGMAYNELRAFRASCFPQWRLGELSSLESSPLGGGGLSSFPRRWERDMNTGHSTNSSGSRHQSGRLPSVEVNERVGQMVKIGVGGHQAQPQHRRRGRNPDVMLAHVAGRKKGSDRVMLALAVCLDFDVTFGKEWILNLNDVQLCHEPGQAVPA